LAYVTREHLHDEQSALTDSLTLGWILQDVLDHNSPKSTHIAWLGNLDKIVAAGFDKGSERSIYVYDPRNLSDKLHVQKLPASSSIMHVLHDEDTNVMLVAGKGDGNILMFEAVDTAPFLHELNEFKSKTPQNGICLLPKGVVNVMNCEIFRLLKLSGTRVEPIRFEVPRSVREQQSLSSCTALHCIRLRSNL